MHVFIFKPYLSRGLTEKEYAHLLRCAEKHEALVRDSEKLKAVLPELAKAKLTISILENALEKVRAQRGC